MTEYLVEWKKSHRVVVNASDEAKAKQMALLTRDTATTGFVDGVVSVSKYDEKLEAQLEWIRDARGDES